MIYLPLELGILTFVIIIRTRGQVQALVPAALIEQTLLRLAAQKLFFNNGLAIRAPAIEK